MQKKPLTNKDGSVRELGRADIKRMKPIREADPEMAAAMAAVKVKRGRGRPKARAPRQMISFRLSRMVVEGIKAGGRGYNARVEKVLKAALEAGEL